MEIFHSWAASQTNIKEKSRRHLFPLAAVDKTFSETRNGKLTPCVWCWDKDGAQKRVRETETCFFLSASWNKENLTRRFEPTLLILMNISFCAQRVEGVSGEKSRYWLWQKDTSVLLISGARAPPAVFSTFFKSERRFDLCCSLPLWHPGAFPRCLKVEAGHLVEKWPAWPRHREK